MGNNTHIVYVHDPLGKVTFTFDLTSDKGRPISLSMEGEMHDENASAWITVEEAKLLKRALKHKIKEATRGK